jgi:hypothetical protein
MIFPKFSYSNHVLNIMGMHNIFFIVHKNHERWVPAVVCDPDERNTVASGSFAPVLTTSYDFPAQHKVVKEG